MADAEEKKEDIKTVSKKNIDRKKVFPTIISGFVLLFCFILFPAFFIYSSLTIYFRNNTENLRQEKLSKMNIALEYMDKYSNNKKYFHYLLSTISESAQKSSDPQLYIKLSIENLKKQYPGKFEFVVWDKDGKVIKELTDKTGYGYVLGKLYTTLYDVKKSVEADSSARVSESEVVKKNLNIVKNFLGRLFVAENLKFPVLEGLAAGPILTELGNGLAFCWYSVGEKISIFCFLSEPMLKDFSGLEKICNSLNSQESDIITGYSLTPDYILPVTYFPPAFMGDLSLAYTTFENAGDSVFENGRAIIRMNMPQPNVRTFCFLPKKDSAWDYEYNSRLWFGRIGCCLLLIYCLFGYWFLYRRHFFSIRWKLTALFLFANLAPICIVGFIAKGYIDNKRLAIRNEIIGDLEKRLREFDARYKSLMDDYTININTEVENLAKKVGNGPLKKEDIDELKRIYSDYECSELLIVASDSKMIDYCHIDNNFGKKEVDFLSTVGAAMIDYTNRDIFEYESGKKDVFARVLSPENSEIIRYAVKNSKKVLELKAAEYVRIYYSYFFGDTKNYNNNYIYMLCWERWAFQNIFLKKYFNSLNSSSFPQSSFFIKSKDGRLAFGTQNFNNELLSIFEKNTGMAEKTNGSVVFNKKRNVYVCLNTTNMVGLTALALYPEEKIDKEINIIIIQIIAGTLISLLLTIIIGHILSLQFLNPIHNLGKAALAIGERKFSYRVPIGDKDEFGHLNQVFNRAIEGLGDFEVARIIQENLFPGNNFDVGDFNIFGRSVVMTTLGGDYYDCFKINDEYQGIIIGDVAGHGIPAGLMMAMAKSGVLSANDEVKLDPTALTSRLHKIFHAIKNDKLKRMMTFMYYVLRVSDGHFFYTNAGHCFPVIVDGINKTATFMDYIATPLGIGPRCRCKNQEFDLTKGQSLVLYTDGIVEAANESGEQFGYDRFKEALIEHYDPNPEVFYYNLYEKVYKKWSPKPDDDLTFIIVNRN